MEFIRSLSTKIYVRDLKMYVGVPVRDTQWRRCVLEPAYTLYAIPGQEHLLWAKCHLQIQKAGPVVK